MKTILVPTDFSDNALNAANYALRMAAGFNARMILLHVFQIPVPVGDLPLFVVTENDMQNQSMADLKLFRKKMNPHHMPVPIDLMAVQGDVAMEIEKVFKASKADLIAVGVKGKNHLEEVIIGSTTHALFNASRCPVLAIPDGVEYKDIHKILIADDHTQEIKVSHEKILKELYIFLKREK